MVTVMSAFAWLGLRWNASWQSSWSEELKTFQALGISACLAFGWPGFELLFIHTRPKWCGILHWEYVLRKAGNLGVHGWWSCWLPQSVRRCHFSKVKFTCSSSLMVGIVSWRVFSERSWDEAFSMFTTLKIGRLHGASNIQLWIERSSGFFAKEASTKCGGMTMFN